MSIRIALPIRSDSKAEPYLRALEKAGLEPVLFGPDSGQSLNDVAGLTLTGGTDVDPALYGASALRETDMPDRERDDYEAAILKAAIARDMPILAICRGHQLFNVVRGGTLIQHLPNTDRHQRKSGGAPVHDAVLSGRMEELFGAGTLRVNSRHHQAVDRVGDGLMVTARDPEDGVVEGLMFPASRFAVCVQWHPEDMVDDECQIRLFTAFADAARLR